jgi:hypothetical protein
MVNCKVLYDSKSPKRSGCSKSQLSMNSVLLQVMIIKTRYHLNRVMKIIELLGEGAYKGGLRKWFDQNWKDISRTVDGKHPECGASAGQGARAQNSQRAYPKCVPAAKAAQMTPSQKRSSSARKRKVERQPGAKGRVDRVKT